MHRFLQYLFENKTLQSFNKTSFYSSILICIFILGTFLRFYDLNWGAPYYFHPDERNIASSISQLHISDNLNPNFFAYGSLPIYFVYGVGIIINILLSVPDISENVLTVSFEMAIIIGRVLSAFFSILTLWLTYLTARKFLSTQYSLFCTFLAAISIGLIQYAHFGTFESHLTFFSIWLLLTLLLFFETKKLAYYILSCVILGMLISIKISSVVLFPLPFLVASIFIRKNIQENYYKLAVTNVFKYLFYLISIPFAIFLLSNPFVVLDFGAFISSMQYESSVASGTLPVFYTGIFYNTVPVIYQFLHVFPFLLNPLIWTFLLPSLVYVSMYSLKRSRIQYRILLLFFFVSFLPQAILFVKWTRYMIPLLPVVYILIGITFKLIFTSSFLLKKIHTVVIVVVISISSLCTFAFINTVYIQPDTRVVASEYIKNQTTSSAKVISEVYDLGIIPFNNFFSNIELINFYDLDNDPAQSEILQNQISQSQLVVLPSQRILKSRTTNKAVFPIGNSFYTSLDNNSDFFKVYQTPCDIWCQITYGGDPIYSYEETSNVFDRPTVTIYLINP